jgi:hypothetical protein
MSRKLSMLEQVRESTRRKMKPQEMDLEGLLLHFLVSGLANPPPPEERRFNPTQRSFIYDTAPAKAYMGSAGNGKSVTAMAVGMTMALTQPGSSGLVARQDYNDLMDTIVKDYEAALESLPPGVLLERQKAPPMKWIIRPAVEGPPSTITFMGLKDTYKGGYKFDWAHVDEADEATEKAVTGLRARLGRGALGHKLLMLTFNPPHKTHWLYTACTGRDATDRVVAEPWLRLFVPEPKENARNLPSNYYEDLSDLPADQFMRLVLGQWGAVFDGEPVYPQFKRALHVRPALAFDPYSPLLRFWDFGYRGPACLWAQQDIEGRLLILREECVRNIEIGPFAQRILGITKAEFPGVRRVVDYGDPAARQKKDTGSTLAVLNEYGITLHFIQSWVDDGLRAVRKLLQQLLGGEAALQIDERRCPTLIDGFLGGYKLDKSGTAPFKDGWYEHVMDALRYGVVNLYGAITQNMERRSGHQQRLQEEANRAIPVTPLAASLRALGLVGDGSRRDVGDSLAYDPSHDPMNWRP